MARHLSGQQPRLMVVVDTEEAFDWTAPFDRNAVEVGHMRHIGRLQSACERWGIRPVYVVDYPIASQEVAVAALQPLLQDGRAVVGAHLHPWVSPPHEEEVNDHNSFPGNLPPALERAKLAALAERIEDSFAIRPVIYKAGRYGIGENTFAILEDLGFLVDLSPAPPYDYRGIGGPDFRYRGLQPEWVGPSRSILSIPGTGTLVGTFPYQGLLDLATSKLGAHLHLGGILSRLGIVERLRLTPEGYGVEDLRRLIRWTRDHGQTLFVLSLHSPSVEPGNTPYVRSEAELSGFFGILEAFLATFMTEFGGLPTDPLVERAALALPPAS